MIVYQIAMILCVCSESVGTAALSDYVDEQDGITTRNGARVEVHNDDIVGILSYNIFVGIAVATIFGSGFFFDLFWPLRKESTSVRIAWKLCSLLVSIMALADVLALTVIVATHRSTITGVSPATASLLFRENGTPTPIYRKNAYCVASVVLLWLGMIASFASTYIMWKSIQHNDELGPMSSKYRNAKGEEASIDMTATTPKPIPTNVQTHPEPYPYT